MPIHVSWDNPDKTILCYRYEDAWTWEEVYAALTNAYEWVDGVDYTVDVIIDLRASSALPAPILTNAFNVNKRQHPRIGLTVAVGANHFAQLMADLFKRLIPDYARRYVLVATLEEAYVLIAQAQQAR